MNEFYEASMKDWVRDQNERIRRLEMSLAGLRNLTSSYAHEHRKLLAIAYAVRNVYSNVNELKAV